MKKNFKLLIYVFILLFVGGIKVQADMSVSATKDLIYVSTSPAASAVYYNTSDNANSKINLASSSFPFGTYSGGKGYVSVKNGTYYFWSVNTSGGSTKKGPYKVTSSCSEETKLNVSNTNAFNVERCYVMSSGSKNPVAEGGNATIASCASGYYLDASKTKVVTNDCSSVNFNSGVSKRYCKVVFQFQCAKKDSGGGNSGGGGGSTVAAATLSGLSVSSGSLSPGFSSGTKSYTVNVGAGVSSISINASASSGSSFVSGFGSRTVNLNYGSNTVYVKVKNSAGKVTTYTININREDGRSTVNTLSSLSVTPGTLEPEFNPGVNSYTVKVTNDVTEVKIDATLTDNTSSYIQAYSPGGRTVELGTNNYYIKVNNARGETNVYTIVVVREDIPSECTTEMETKALLKGINFSIDIDGIELDQIEDFDPTKKVYDGIKVPYKVTSLTIDGYTQDEGDTVKVEGAEDFEENIPKSVSVYVTSKVCPNVTNMYTFNITRQPEVTEDTNPELDDLKIKGHDEFEFKPNETDFDIDIKSGEKSLEFEYFPASGSKTTCEAQGNEDLQLRSKITIVCTAEDKETTAEYTINVRSVKKGMNGFLVFLLILIFVLILIYLVLRLMGYKIYFNLEVIGAFFRGIGEKIRNIFS